MVNINWLSIPVELSSFDIIRKTVFEAAGDTPQVRKALLALDEVLTNIVSYSGAASLAFSCCCRDDVLCVAFSDDGIQFDPTTAPLPEKEFDLLDSGGMGLKLIRQCAKQMCYSYQDGCNTLFLQFPIEKSHGF